jgi:ParB/RepB/Spo0J family partition protein
MTSLPLHAIEPHIDAVAPDAIDAKRARCKSGVDKSDGLKEPVSGGSPDHKPEQRSSFAGDAARPSLENAPCSTYAHPRKAFNRDELNERKQSIKETGLINPPVVRPGKSGDTYELIAGERRVTVLRELHAEDPKRWPLCRVTVNDIADADVPVVQLVENLQRKDLTTTEIVGGLKRLLQLGRSQDEIATKLGWSDRTARRYIRLTSAPDWILSSGHRVQVKVKKLDEQGNPVLDPETKKPVLTTKTHPGLDIYVIEEILKTYLTLVKHDKASIETAVEGYRPAAERVTKSLIEHAAADQWSVRKAVTECAKAIARVTGERSEPMARPKYVADAERLEITAAAFKEMGVADKEILARQAEKFFREIGFKNVILSVT